MIPVVDGTLIRINNLMRCNTITEQNGWATQVLHFDRDIDLKRHDTVRHLYAHAGFSCTCRSSNSSPSAVVTSIVRRAGGPGLQRIIIEHSALDIR